MPNLGELRARILRNLDRANAPTTEQSDVDAWINQVLREDICSAHNWDVVSHEATVSSGVGTDKYLFPDSGDGTLFKDCRFIRFRTSSTEDYRELEECSEKALYQNFTELTNGEPLAWARVSPDQFMVRPIPDGEYTFKVHIWEYPETLSGDTSSNTFTNHYARLIEYGTTARAMLYYGEDQSAQVWGQMFQIEKARAINADKIRLTPYDRTLKPSLAAGRPITGLRRGTVRRPAAYSWNT